MAVTPAASLTALKAALERIATYGSIHGRSDEARIALDALEQGRVLFGTALQRIATYGNHLGSSEEAVLAQQALAQATGTPAKPVPPVVFDSASIIRHVLRHYRISHQGLRGRSQKRNVTQARNMAAYLLSQHTTLSRWDIGMLLGRQHTTVSDARRRLAELLRTDVKVRANHDTIFRALQVQAVAAA